MKFYEAALKMKDGDVFVPKTAHTPVKLDGGFFKATAHTCNTKLSQEYMSVEGEIIPVKPNVLQAGEIAEKWLDRSEESSMSYYFECSREAFKNGRLEMFQEFDGLIEALRSQIEKVDRISVAPDSYELEKIREFLNNLPKP